MGMPCDGTRVTSTKRSFVVVCVISVFVLFIVLNWGKEIVYWSNGPYTVRPVLENTKPHPSDSSVGANGVGDDLLSDREWSEEERGEGHELRANVSTNNRFMDVNQFGGDYHKSVVPTGVAAVTDVEHTKERPEQSPNVLNDGLLMFVEPAVAMEVSSTKHNTSEMGQDHALHGAIINAILQSNNSVESTSLHVVEPTEEAELRDAEYNKEEMGPNPAHRNASVTSSGAYLGVVSITEQLSANTKNFIQLAYMSKLWNLSIIYPVVTERSQISSIPHSYSRHTLPLGSIFNLTNVSKRLQKCLEMPRGFYFHSLNEALIYSSRDVLVLRFMVSGMSVGIKECSQQSKNTINDVMKTLNYHVEKVSEEARAVHGDGYRFHMWKVICVRASPSIAVSVSKLSSYLKNLVARKRKEYNTGVMVVVPQWRKFKPIRSGYYYYDPHLVYNYTACGIESFPHSDLVVKAAREFYKSLSLLQPCIAVYVRTERLIQTDNKQRGHINRCLQKFRLVLERVKVMFQVSHKNIVLVSDVGPHGSNTLRGSRKAYSIMSRFKSWNIYSAHYDPKSYKDFPQLNVFVASVEKEFLSLSDVLITIGWGGFQESVADHFKARHSADRLFVLCSDTGDHLPNITLNH